MKLRIMMVVACAVFVTPLFAQTEGTYLIRYLINSAGLDVVNMSNTGSSIGLQTNLTPDPGGPTGRGTNPFNGAQPAQSDGWICANVYVLTPDEQLAECCSCPLSPNSLKSLLAVDLTSNTLTGVNFPPSFTVKLVASVAGVPTPKGFPVSTFHTCDIHTAATVGQLDGFGNPRGQPLATGLAAWAFTTRVTVGTAATETPFTVGQLSNQPFADSELKRLTGLCQNIINNGSGSGVCGVCRLGAL
jgi:hypothetical protein